MLALALVGSLKFYALIYLRIQPLPKLSSRSCRCYVGTEPGNFGNVRQKKAGGDQHARVRKWHRENTILGETRPPFEEPDSERQRANGSYSGPYCQRLRIAPCAAAR
ncbi:hypothetical protein IW144_001212, partial [Coemansia sp. RSA 522]